MNQLTTQGIILTRTNYGEADRIITLLSSDSGKLSLMARGVRKPKSKLAGGIELFSVSSISYIRGRGDLGTLVSSQLTKHYGEIIKHIDRVQLGYELIKQLHRATEDEPEPEYFTLLQTSFEALNTPNVALPLVQVWFQAQLLQLAGHAPNLVSDNAGEALRADQNYSFDFDSVAFTQNQSGAFAANQIKFLRLLFAQHTPIVLQQVAGSSELAVACQPLVQTMLTSYIRV